MYFIIQKVIRVNNIIQELMTIITTSIKEAIAKNNNNNGYNSWY